MAFSVLQPYPLHPTPSSKTERKDDSMTRPREMIRGPPAALAFLALVEPLIGSTVFLTSFVEKGSVVSKAFDIKPKQNLTPGKKQKQKNI